MTERPVQFKRLFAEEQTFIDKYLGAVLSGQTLEVVDLNFWAFGHYQIGLVLGAMEWPRLKKARITDISISQDELEKFCSRLGYRLELICLHSIELLRGRWSGALDMLREKVLSRCLGMQCRVEFIGLTGGEFGKEKRDGGTRLDRFAFNHKANRKRWVREELLIVIRSQNYVSGVEEVENPLKGNVNCCELQVVGIGNVWVE
jgi:hypothetical protein